MAKTIELNKKWQLGDKIGRGGFGEVYLATAQDGSEGVIKLVPKAPGASRELLFEELSGKSNILPIYETGEWEGKYVLVMPKAERSLREYIDSAGGKLNFNEVLSVLTDIITALDSLDTEVVHRDLKPENVLFYENHWCLADFGIARYAEATTAPDTLKYSKTKEYAAPEQWTGERATGATDIYAFGIMAFEIIQGQRPFLGPDVHDFRDQHLYTTPPPLGSCPVEYSSLVNECLFKIPAARPTSANVLARLKGFSKPSSSAEAALREANDGVVKTLATEHALASAEKSRENIRTALYDTAQDVMVNIAQMLQTRILNSASAIRVAQGGILNLNLGQGNLIIDTIKRAPENSLSAYGYNSPFDVIAFTSIIALQPSDIYGNEGRAHSLWYCDAHDEGVFRWFELAFMVQALLPDQGSIHPFAMSPTDQKAGGAFIPMLGARQLAWEPVSIDQGEEEKFIQRWIKWFSSAVNGSLGRPSMPEVSGGKFRPPNRRS